MPPPKNPTDTAAKPGKKKDNVVHLRLPPEHIDGLDKLAKENGIPRASVIGIAVARLLKTGI
jgi:predicted DNA-binding protein